MSISTVHLYHLLVLTSSALGKFFYEFCNLNFMQCEFKRLGRNKMDSLGTDFFPSRSFPDYIFIYFIILVLPQKMIGIVHTLNGPKMAKDWFISIA